MNIKQLEHRICMLEKLINKYKKQVPKTYEELEIQYYVDKDKIRENKIIKELKSRGYIVQKCSLETI